MNYQVKLTETAVNDLLDILFSGAELSGSRDIARKFVEELRENVISLSTFPERGAVPHDRVLTAQEYRFLVHKEYLILYTVDKDAAVVYVQAILNGMRDYPKILRKTF
ncbi:MAG: type II toxin-antitoxin system RelE/ParE family toxin [Clostridia bacterium]|nr:type II toxin-antitoxin system RelE/ParE family toxin [Clostridia bacterium]